MPTPSIAIVVPTLNAASDWPRFTPPLLASVPADRVLVLDSSSDDGTAELARSEGFRVHSIPRHEFNHGGTRQLSIEMFPDAEIFVFLTQDAVLAGHHSIDRLVNAFADESVAAAYGRQLPRPGATPIEAHARLFNYPDRSGVRTFESRKQLGFKAIFISNSFAAYRRDALSQVGGFPSDVIFGEDTITAAKFLRAGWKIAYVAEAQVHHSHAYTWTQELKRYFDIGVLHSREKSLFAEFGSAGGEGKRFVLSELSYLCPRHAHLIPSALIRTAMKLMGYRLGRIEQRLGPAWKRRFSMHRSYWAEPTRGQ